MNTGVIPYQTFNCPHCGAPGHVEYGSAKYSCDCRFRNYGQPYQAPVSYPQPMRCGSCGQAFVLGEQHICVTV